MSLLDKIRMGRARNDGFRSPALTGQLRLDPALLHKITTGKPLTVLIGIAALFLAYVTAQMVLSGDIPSLAFLAMAFAGAAAAVMILNNWRTGLYFFFGWLFFEDFARKFLGNNMVIYFGKDLLVLLVYIAYVRARRTEHQRVTFSPPFRVALAVFLWFAVAQVFNPASTSVFYGLLGLKLYFLYVPLMYLGYVLIDSEQSLRRFFTFTAVLVLVVSCLGVAQSIIGPTFLSPAVLQDDIRDLAILYRTSPLTGQVAYRPTSVFVSAGRFQNTIVVSWIALLGFGGYLILRSKRGRTITFVTIGILAAAAAMTASRGVVMWCGGNALVVLAAFFWGAPWKQKEASRVLRSIQRIILLGGLSLVALAVFFPSEIGSRMAIYSETLSPYSTASELAYRTREYPLTNFLGAFDTPRWPYGYGTGTASLGIQYVSRILHAPQTGISVENGYGQLVVEMGVLGLVFWLILATSLTLSAWKVAKQLRGSPWFPIAFVLFWLVFMMFFPMGYTSMASYQDFLVNAYFWLFIGILFRLPSLALSAQFAAAPHGHSSGGLPLKDSLVSPTALVGLDGKSFFKPKDRPLDEMVRSDGDHNRQNDGER